MVNLEQIQQDVSKLPEEAQILVTDLIESLKIRYSLAEKQEIVPQINPHDKAEEWGDFIGCMETESDLSQNYKTYLKQKLNEKFNHY